MSRVRNGSNPLLLVALMLPVSICSSTLFASETPFEYSRHVEWPKNLPSPDTVVYMDTPVGRFRLPIGYTADPTIFAVEKKTVTDPDGHRIFRFGKLEFKFVMPTGAMSDNKVRWVDVVDATGRTDPAKYVVWFFDSRRDVAGRNVPIDIPKGTLVEGRAAGLAPNLGHSYRGRIDVPATGDQVEAELYDCSDRDICASNFYFEREHLSFSVFLPIEHHQDAFLIAAKASELLAQWTVQR